jgi:type III pantothenate kinase
MKKSKITEILHLVDIGNSNATYGLAIHGRIKTIESVPVNSIPEKIRIYAKKRANYKNIVLIASVVPKNTEKVTSELYARGISEIIEIGKDIKVPLHSFYKNSEKLGIDRKIDAYGAIQAKKLPCIVFDFGTALTCDLVSEKGVFLGGLIIPGPATSLQSLLSNTAMLPKLFSLKKTLAKSYGQSTDECIQHGFIQAYAAMTDGLIAKLSKEFERKPHVIITGGFSSFIGKIIHSKAEINPSHTLQSMLKLYEAWKKI